MIHHYSIPVQDTLHVAQVMAWLFDGSITGFGPYHNSYIVWFGDQHGSALELFPAGTEMFPASDPQRGQANFRHNPEHSRFVATHAAISINQPRAFIFEVAKSQGWRALELPRGGFNVIEFWVENHVMIELLTPDMTQNYLASTRQFIKRVTPTPAAS
jgi:hypothetical protein